MHSENTMMHSWNSSRFILKLVFILVLGAIIIISILRDRIVNYPQFQVSVIGQGKVSYTPDTALVTLGVQKDKVATSASALEQLNTSIDAIIKAATETGIKGEDIQTRGFFLTTHYDYTEGISVASGYDASQQVVVKIHNVNTNKDMISEFISKATKAGANRIDGVTFEISNIEELKQEARLKAITDAKSKATVLSDAAGVRLKRVIGWWENIIQAPGPNQPFYYDGKGGGANVSGTVPSGLQEIIIEINVNYLIK